MRVARTVLRVNLPDQRGQSLPKLVEIMQRLLAPDGCPWDREQSLETLRTYVIEEAFEVVDAIDSKSPDHLREELGDLLLQIVFQAELARVAGWFGPDDVVTAITEKLVRRHPHVFGEHKVDNATDALANWEKLKAEEKKGRGTLDGVPPALPALLRAQRVGEKASAVGYDWPDVRGARAKVDEELAELDEALASGDKASAERELGDVLFAMASVARKEGIDAEAALRGSLARFTTRFKSVETTVRNEQKTLREMTAEQLDVLWQAAKRDVG